MIPHVYFAAYARHKGANRIAKYLPAGLPVPTKEEYGEKFKTVPMLKSKGYKAWLKKHDLNNFTKRTGTLYAMFHDVAARNLIVVSKIRGEEKIPDLLFRLGRWNVSENDLEYYCHLFWNTSDWASHDYHDYLSLLTGEDWRFLDLALSDAAVEVIFTDLGLNIAPRKNREVLDRFLAKAYNSFEHAEGTDAIKWANLGVRLIKEMRHAEEIDPTAIIKELNFELGTPDIIHLLDDDEDIV